MPSGSIQRGQILLAIARSQYASPTKEIGMQNSNNSWYIVRWDFSSEGISEREIGWMHPDAFKKLVACSITDGIGGLYAIHVPDMNPDSSYQVLMENYKHHIHQLIAEELGAREVFSKEVASSLVRAFLKGKEHKK
jgi:hypothetical protein